MPADVLLVALGWLLGSIPTGLLLARRVGVDVRSAGSGNVGATNVARTAGRGLGAWTLAGDAGKGALAVALARGLSGDPTIVAATAVAAVVGHVFNPFLAFRGGKGVATGLGVLLLLAPAAMPVALVAFATAFAFSRIVSLASITATGAAAIAIPALGHPRPTIVAALAIGCLIVARHAENLRRLRDGTEPRFRSRD